MMLKRLAVFEYSHPLEAPLKVAACGHCFASVLLPPAASMAGTLGPSTPRSEAKRPRPGHTGETPEAKSRCAAWSIDDVLAYLEQLGLVVAVNTSENQNKFSSS